MIDFMGAVVTVFLFLMVVSSIAVLMIQKDLKKYIFLGVLIAFILVYAIYTSIPLVIELLKSCFNGIYEYHGYIFVFAVSLMIFHNFITVKRGYSQ